MNKTELANAVALKTGFTKKDADKAIAAVLEAIMDSLKNNEKVQLIGFGTFDIKHRPARTVRNPRTGEPVDIDATDVPVFKAGKAFKGAVK